MGFYQDKDFGDEDRDRWAAEALSKLYGREIEEAELPLIFAAENERRTTGLRTPRSISDDQPLPKKRARLRLNDGATVIAIPVNRKRQRVRLSEAVILIFGPTYEQRVRQAFVEVEA